MPNNSSLWEDKFISPAVCRGQGQQDHEAAGPSASSVRKQSEKRSAAGLETSELTPRTHFVPCWWLSIQTHEPLGDTWRPQHVMPVSHRQFLPPEPLERHPDTSAGVVKPCTSAQNCSCLSVFSASKSTSQSHFSVPLSHGDFYGDCIEPLAKF